MSLLDGTQGVNDNMQIKHENLWLLMYINS